MGHYEINIVSEQWKYWSVTTIATHKYCLDKLKKRGHVRYMAFHQL